MNLRPRHREDPEINLISLIDVLLVLLIFFMISTTFQQEGAGALDDHRHRRGWLSRQ
jgi:biopolymer transport protein ExbD